MAGLLRQLKKQFKRESSGSTPDFALAAEDGKESFLTDEEEMGNQNFKRTSLEDQASRIAHALTAKNKLLSFFQFSGGTINRTPLIESNLIGNNFLNLFLTSSERSLQLVLSPDDFYLMIVLGVYEFLQVRKALPEYSSTIALIPDVCKGLQNLQETEDFDEHELDMLCFPFSTSRCVDFDVLGYQEIEQTEFYAVGSSDVFRIKTRSAVGHLLLEGCLTDFQSLIERVDRFSQLIPEFNWYLLPVRKHLERIVSTLKSESAAKRANKEFWNNTLSDEYFCSDELAPIKSKGWIFDFVAYIQYPSGSKCQNKDRGDNGEIYLKKFDAPALIVKDKIEADTNSCCKETTKYVVGFFWPLQIQSTQRRDLLGSRMGKISTRVNWQHELTC